MQCADIDTGEIKRNETPYYQVFKSHGTSADLREEAEIKALRLPGAAASNNQGFTNRKCRIFAGRPLLDWINTV